MKVKETIDDIEFDALLQMIKEEKESDTYVRKAVEKIGSGAKYVKIGALRGESLSPDLSQWKKSHDADVSKAEKIKKTLLSGIGDKDKIANLVKELRSLTSNIKSLRKKIDKNVGKAAAKPEKLRVSRARKSAAETEAYEKKSVKDYKKAKKSDWKKRVQMAKNFNDFSKRGK